MRQHFWNTEQTYGSITKILHWTMAVLIIGLLVMGLVLDDIPPTLKLSVMMFHKSFGITVLFLGLIRLIWRAQNTQLIYPASIPSYQQNLAHGLHACLYSLMLALPLSGWLMTSGFGRPIAFFNLFNLPLLITPNKEWGLFFKACHETIPWILISVLITHIGAALYHHFIKKDTILKRML